MIVTERTFDLANRYRVVVSISNERAITLKFQDEVDDEVAFAEVKKILEAESKRQEAEAEIAALENELKELENEYNY